MIKIIVSIVSILGFLLAYAKTKKEHKTTFWGYVKSILLYGFMIYSLYVNCDSLYKLVTTEGEVTRVTVFFISLSTVFTLALFIMVALNISYLVKSLLGKK